MAASRSRLWRKHVIYDKCAYVSSAFMHCVRPPDLNCMKHAINWKLNTIFICKRYSNCYIVVANTQFVIEFRYGGPLKRSVESEGGNLTRYLWPPLSIDIIVHTFLLVFFLLHWPYRLLWMLSIPKIDFLIVFVLCIPTTNSSTIFLKWALERSCRLWWYQISDCISIYAIVIQIVRSNWINWLKMFAIYCYIKRKW